MDACKYCHLYTGPIHHDILGEIIIGLIALLIIGVIWKVGKFKWPMI